MPSPRKQDIPYGMLREWEVSDIMNFADIDFEEYPDRISGETKWTAIEAEPSGLVNLSKVYPRTYRTGDALYARTFLYVEEDKLERYSFGYSDLISTAWTILWV